MKAFQLIHRKIKKIPITGFFSAILLLAFLLAGDIGLIFSPKKSFSEAENRVLESLPEISLPAVADGSFMKAAQDYVGDHFVLREFFVSLNTEIQFLAGKREFASDYSQNPAQGGVYFGNNGHLYEVLLPDRSGILQKNAEAFHFFAQKTGIPLWMLAVPSGAEEQSQNLPAFAPSEDQKYALELLNAGAPKTFHVVDVFDRLSLKSGKDYYYKTDHHWTAYGAYVGYQALAQAMNFQPLPEDAFTFQKAPRPFYGTLYSKAINAWQQPDSLIIPYFKSKTLITQQTGSKIHDGIYWEEYLNKKDQYSVFLGGNSSVTMIQNPKATGGKLLLLKDSYANSMLPFLSQNFSEIHMIDLRYYNLDIYDYIQQNGIETAAAVYSIKQLNDVSVANKLMR